MSKKWRRRRRCCHSIVAGTTAVVPARFVSHLRVANRLRRLCPLGDGELFKFYLKSSVCQRQTGLPKGNPPCVFPSFPPCTPFGSPSEAIECPIGLQALLPRQNRRVKPSPLISTPSARTPPKDGRTSHTAHRSGSTVPFPPECSSPRPAPAARQPESHIWRRTLPFRAG